MFDSSESEDDDGNEGKDVEEDDARMLEELQHYLDEKVEKKITDPLQWWIEHKNTYPRLWRMARDYLTIPGMCFHPNTTHLDHF
jgi:hypothetical protein